VATATAFEVVGKHPEVNPKVKTSAFENEIQKGQVLRVLAVELRDNLLSILPSDVILSFCF